MSGHITAEEAAEIFWGQYRQHFCPDCENTIELSEWEPCPNCGSHNIRRVE